MFMKKAQHILILMAAIACLSSCAFKGNDSLSGSDALTWTTWNGYDNFFSLLNEKCPDITLDFVSYTGANQTGYSWEQLRADDITDIFITSQILDEDLASERLVDLSGYDFINNFSNSILDQVAVDGGIYLLPVNYTMYGIYYNKTLMEEKGWELPGDFSELESLCEEIRKEGLIPGVIGTQLTGNTFSAVFNLAKTSWLTTPEGLKWEREFLAGNATAEGMWEGTMDYVQRYLDMGMFTVDPEDRNNPEIILDYLGNRKAVFCTQVLAVNITEFPENGDKLGMMPYIGEDGSKNIYMYSPLSYIGISRRLTEPGNEKKLENAIRLLSLLYSREGQEMFITNETPCMMSVLDNKVSEDTLIYDAQQALKEGRAFPMTYAGWEGVLSDMGQAYKDWFRGENGMDGPKCIARMDELQNGYLSRSGERIFGEAVEDFTLEETAELLGKALGSAVGADAVMVPLGVYRTGNVRLKSGVTGKLYAGEVGIEKVNMIMPGVSGEYAMMTMTGKQAMELAKTGLDTAGEDAEPFPYVLVTKGSKKLKDSETYQVAFFMQGYTEEVGRTYSAVVYEGALRDFLIAWLKEQKTVKPGQNPWN